MNINVNSTQADSALALLPMFVPGALTSVQPTGFAHLGVPLVIYPAATGLAVVIDPVTTLSTTLAAFDTVVVWLNGQPTSAIKIIQPGEENDRILMYLPPGLLVNGINTMFYRVTRSSQNFKDSKPVLDVLFNTPAPTIITVSHPPSIGPGQPAVITLTVGYARPYDTVTLTIGTWSITFTNSDPTKPLTHTLTAAELQQIGDGTHPVSARVIDQLTNSNVSATTSITITANQKVYNPPIIVQGEPGKVINVPALNGKDATIHGQTWTGISVGQQVWLKLTGQKPDGSTDTLQIWNGGASKVNATWISQRFWPKPLPASFLSQLADASSLRMEFWVSEDKSNNFATATKFADQVYTIKAVAQSLIEDFEAVPQQFIGFGQTIQTPLMTIKHIGGGATAGVTSVNDGFLTVPGKMEGNCLHIGYKNSGVQRLALILAFSCSQVRFWYAATDTLSNAVYFYGHNGLLGHAGLSNTGRSVVEFAFAASGITRIEFDNSPGDWYVVDKFSFLPG